MKYYIHKEGKKTILISGLVSMVILLSFIVFQNKVWVDLLVLCLLALVWIGIVSFFRIPKRTYPVFEENQVISPADGEIVLIEKVVEKEFFGEERLKVSVFMSPLNVHVNRFPVSGQVLYTKYHEGKYWVAWHPKSSELNERATTVVKTKKGCEVLVRQVAGAVARRIVTYAKEGNEINQGEELGFIRFGSRVDLFLPLETQVQVKIGAKVKGGVSVLAEL